MGWADGLHHGSKNSRRKPILGSEPVLIRLVNSPQNTRGRSGKHHGARGERIVLGDQVLRHPTVMCRTPNGNGGQSGLLVARANHIKEGFSAAEHSAPVFSDLSEMWRKPGRLAWVQKAGPLVQSEQLIDSTERSPRRHTRHECRTIEANSSAFFGRAHLKALSLRESHTTPLRAPLANSLPIVRITVSYRGTLRDPKWGIRTVSKTEPLAA